MARTPANTAADSNVPSSVYCILFWSAVAYFHVLHKPLLYAMPCLIQDLTKCQMQLKNEIHTVAFHLDVRLQLIQLLSEPSTQEWLVELSTTEVGLSLSLSLSLSVCVCVYMCIRILVCVCARICIHLSMCLCVHKRMHVHVCTCVCMSVCVCVECVWMHVYACGDVCVCVWMCVCVWGGVSLSRCSKMILSFIIHVDSVQAHHNNDSTAYRWRLKVLQKPNFTPKGSGHGAEAGNSPPPLPPDNSGGLLAKSPLLHHLWGRNKEGAFWEWWSETHICADWGWQQRLLNRTPSALYACRISYLV